MPQAGREGPVAAGERAGGRQGEVESPRAGADAGSTGRCAGARWKRAWTAAGAETWVTFGPTRRPSQRDLSSRRDELWII